MIGRCAVVLVAACTTFEDPSIVIDLRVIAMTASPPEQVLDVPLDRPPQLGELVEQLQPSYVCAVIADPGHTRELQWSMTACLVDNGRCDPNRPTHELARATLSDPELVGGQACAMVAPDGNLVAILSRAFDDDPVHGLAGLDYAVELRVRGADDPDPAHDQYAVKELRISARLPADRVPNHNPTLRQLRSSIGGAQRALVTPCFGEPVVAHSNQRVDLQPQELDDTREMYFAATIDGTFETFTETLTYQWLATDGSFSDETTGGPTDFAGNSPPLGNAWFAPTVEARSRDVSLWLIQRDERYGVSVYPACLRVEP